MLHPIIPGHSKAETWSTLYPWLSGLAYTLL